MCLNMNAVCVAYLSVGVCLFVCECVFLWYHRVVFAYNHLILFFAFLYLQNLLPGHVTKPLLVSVTQ